jgi:hypothetical protein
MGWWAMTDEHIIDLRSGSERKRVIGLLAGAWAEWHENGRPPLELVVRHREEKRRLRQNALYWKLIDEISKQLEDAMAGEYHSKRVWDEYLKERFLGVESASVMGKSTHRTVAHKDLGVHSFADYLTQCFVFSGEHEVQMPEPWHEDYQGTLGEDDQS